MPKCTSSICFTGASYGLKKFKSDYVHYIDNEINVKDVTNVNWVIGIGTTVNKCFDQNGVAWYLPYMLYHMQRTYVFIFYLMTYHQIHGGHSVV